MNCPYCNEKMEKGLIQSPQEISWLKGEKRKMFGRAEFHKDSVVLSKLSFMKAMKRFPSVLRTQYALAVLEEKNVSKAETIKGDFDKAAKSYPYPHEIESERELMRIVDQKC